MYAKEEKFIIFDDVFDRLMLEYEQCCWCIIPNVRIYKYWKEYRLVSEEYFQKKRNSCFVIGRIYKCNKIQTTKAKISLEAYYGITRYKAIREVVNTIAFTDVEALESGLYTITDRVSGILYVPNEVETKQIIKNKHRRVKAHGLRRIFK